MKHQQSCTPNTGNGGNWYNFRAAGVDYKTTEIREAKNSICPLNWLLPRHEGDKSFHNLGTIYSATTGANFYNAPLSFPFSGYHQSITDTAKNFNRGTEGWYWTFKQYNSIAMQVLNFNKNSIIYDEQRNMGTYGLPLRCVAR